MTTILVSERWTFAGVDLSTYATLVSTVAEGDGLPALRGDDITVPTRTGRVVAPKVYDGRRLALGLWVSHLDAAGAEGVTPARQARTNLDTLTAVLARRQTAPLVRLMPDGSTRTATAEVVGVDVPAYPVDREGFGLVVDFALADPWFYAAASATTTVVAASPTPQVITNPGSATAERVAFDFLGPLSNPRVTNTTTGWYLELLVTVAAGQHALVDCWAATATNNGVQAIGSLRHSGGQALFALVPGANVLSLTSGTLAGSVTTTYSPPYA